MQTLLCLHNDPIHKLFPNPKLPQSSFLIYLLSVHPVMSQLQSSETHEIFHFSEQQGIIDVWKLSYNTVTLKSL